MRVVYDLRKSPATHDFCNFLARAIRDACGEMLDVEIVRGLRDWSVRDKVVSAARREWAAYDLLPQLARLCVHVRDVRFVDEGGQTHGYESTGGFVEPIFGASEYARAAVSRFLKNHLRPVSISLRHSQFQTSRNANGPEWVKVADWLKENGYTPIMVPDIEASVIKGWPGYVPAAMNADIRLALYEQCHMNLMTNFGPMLIALMSKARVMVWKIVDEKVGASSLVKMKKSYLAPGCDWGNGKFLFDGEDTAANIIPRLSALADMPEITLADTSIAETDQTSAEKVSVIAKGVLSKDERLSHMRYAMSFGFPYLKESEPHEKTLHIACYGPSLKNTYPLIRGDCISVSGAHDFLVSKGIKPTYHADMDPRGHKSEMLTPVDGVTYLLSTVCHKNMVDKVAPFTPVLWHIGSGLEHDALVKELNPDGFLVDTGSVVGLAAIGLGYVMGYRSFVIHGMDCCIKNDQLHAGNHTGKSQKMLRVTVGENGKEFDTTPQLASAANEFIDLANVLPGCRFDVLGDGMLSEMLKYAVKEKAAA